MFKIIHSTTQDTLHLSCYHPTNFSGKGSLIITFNYDVKRFFVCTTIYGHTNQKLSKQ